MDRPSHGRGVVTAIVVLHPGAMGVSVAASFAIAGHDVRWVADGRSGATAARALEAGLAPLPTLAEGCAHAELIVSVCPPAAAVDVARRVAAEGFAGTYLDANAISPATMADVAAVVAEAGATPVDGSIIGLPAHDSGTTRLYLSGDGAAVLAGDLVGGPLDVIAIAGAIGAASALKMAYAGWTKGSSALLLALVAFASEMGVYEALLDEWGRSMPNMPAQAEGRAAGVGPKAWRFVGEMQEIAASLRDAGVPGDFHDGAAAVYQALAGFKDADPPPDLAAVIDALREA